MAKKKSNAGVIILSIVIALVLLGGAGFLIYKYTGNANVIVKYPETCYETKPQEIPSGTFECPSTASSCTGKVWLNCNQPTGSTPTVIFRSNAVDDDTFSKIYDDRYHDYDGGDAWIAVDLYADNPDKKGVLVPFVWDGYSGSISSNCRYYGTQVKDSNGRVMTTPQGYQIYYDGRYNRLYVYESCGKRHKFEVDYSAVRVDTSLASKEPYASNFQEIISGNQDAYSCCQEGGSGSDVDVSICDAKQTAWETYDSFTLYPNEKVNWDGKITVDVSYGIKSECQYNIANPDDMQSYWECYEQDGCGKLSDSLSYCDDGQVYIEDTQSCSAPYTASLTLTQPSYSQTDAIKGELRLKDTGIVSNVNIDFQLYTIAGDLILSKSVPTYNGKAEFSIGAQPIGTYEMRAKVNHPLGESYSNNVRFSVVQPMSMVLYPKNIKQNTGDVEITAIITDASGDPKTDIDRFDFEGTGCGTKDYASKTTGTFKTTSDRGSEWTIIANVDEACSSFIFKVVAIDEQDYRSNAKTQAVNVEKSTVVIESVDEGSLHNKEEGVHTFKFLVLNEKRQPITPQNLVVRVQEKGGCYSGDFCTAEGSQFFGKNIPAITATSTGTGQYQFSHDFEDGLNFIFISASADGLSDTTYDTSLHFWEVDEDIVNPDPSDPNDPAITTFPTTTIVTIGVVLVAIIIFGLMIFRRKKK